MFKLVLASLLCIIFVLSVENDKGYGAIARIHDGDITDRNGDITHRQLQDDGDNDDGDDDVDVTDAPDDDSDDDDSGDDVDVTDSPDNDDGDDNDDDGDDVDATDSPDNDDDDDDDGDDTDDDDNDGAANEDGDDSDDDTDGDDDGTDGDDNDDDDDTDGDDDDDDDDDDSDDVNVTDSPDNDADDENSRRSSGNFDDGYRIAQEEAEQEASHLNAAIGTLAGIIGILLIIIAAGAYYIRSNKKGSYHFQHSSVKETTMEQTININQEKEAIPDKETEADATL